MQLVLATNNDHKLAEFKEITGRLVVSASNFGLKFTCAETGASFFENAWQKAQALQQLLSAANVDIRDLIIIADDSGLVIDALGGQPGINSARFGGVDLHDADRNQLILDVLGNQKNRQAHYVCCLVALLATDCWVAVQENWHGEIAAQASSGSTGFGYDPIFYVSTQKLTVADMDLAQKHSQSHRAKAWQRLAKLL